MKVGLLRCAQTEEICPGTTDFKMIQEKKGVFQGITEEIILIGFTSCGGCPGKKAVFRAQELVARGADTIVLTSCITKGTPIGFACPFARKMESAIRENIEKDIVILTYTH